jgi:hypothetical protein
MSTEATTAIIEPWIAPCRRAHHMSFTIYANTYASSHQDVVCEYRFFLML